MTALRLAAALCLCLPLLGVAAAAEQVPRSRTQIALSFAPVVKAVAPAVVNIYTRRIVRQAPVSPFSRDPFFRRFFGDQFGFGMPEERMQRSLGSGVVIDGGTGLVVTNHHVIKDSDEITVVLADRREFEATVVGTDERTDLALLRVELAGEKLPALPLGDSDSLEVGDLVLAIGNPFGVGQTVTSGIVSALARTTVGISDFRSFIQTDAAINPGNSGGALVDMKGELVGINTAIYSRDGGSVGIGFAIPSEMVEAVLAGIGRNGKPVRAWLGAAGQPVMPDMAPALGLARPMGVLVNGLYPGGPAETAGLRVGDVVVAVNGREIDDPAGLRFRIATLPVGGTADVEVLRRGEAKTLRVALRPPAEEPPRALTEIGGRNPFSGATVANLNPALAEELGLAMVMPGVIVTRLRRGSIAHRMHLRPGDLVLRVNEAPIQMVADLTAALESRAARWQITVSREGETITFAVGG